MVFARKSRLTLLDKDCDCALHLRDVCRFADLDLDAIVVSFLVCGHAVDTLSERPHICDGRAGAAARMIMLGCISGKVSQIKSLGWRCNECR